MNIEIERKFLIDMDNLAAAQACIANTTEIEQGYLCYYPAIRVRIINQRTSQLCIKYKNLAAEGTQEFEYPIPIDDAKLLIQQTNSIIKKRRHSLGLPFPGLWVLDEFLGKLYGLYIIEVEKIDEPIEQIPTWLGKEVTLDERYYNVALSATQKIPEEY